ncbi:hypothetical protein [Kribbella sp. NPDC050459]|uniref:hypothetical protein n=1 Tax=Kribbella sp. NPDC050459 TaxID=3155785 RepID=UPI003406EF93
MSGSGGPPWPGSAASSADEAWLTAIVQAAAGDSQAPLELLVEYHSLVNTSWRSSGSSGVAPRNGARCTTARLARE